MLRGGGAADHGLALEVLAVARNGGYLENAAHRFVAREFGEELRGCFGTSFAGVVLRWGGGSEALLREGKGRGGS